MCEVLEPGQYFKIKEPETGFSDIGGYQEVKQRIEEMIVLPLKHPETFKKAGLNPPRGVLLWGPPNSYATFAEAAAKEAGVTLISAQAEKLLEDEHQITHVFEAGVINSPSIIFISDIEILAPRKELESRLIPPPSEIAPSSATRLLFKEVDKIVERDDVRVLVSSSRPDILEPALLRNGRIDRKIYVPHPEFEDRLEILKIAFKGVPLAEDVTLEKIAELTAYYVPWQLITLPREATLMGIKDEKANFKEVRLKHIQDALKRLEPELTPELIRKYDEIYKEECKHRYMY